jgi:hypothetical protein
VIGRCRRDRQALPDPFLRHPPLRPEPPGQLDDAERRARQAIVDASPDGFLDGAGQLILRQVVTQVAIGERHARRLRKMVEAGVDDVEAEIMIGRAHAEAMKNTVHGMTALRATPKSRMRSRERLLGRRRDAVHGTSARRS